MDYPKMLYKPKAECGAIPDEESLAAALKGNRIEYLVVASEEDDTEDFGPLVDLIGYEPEAPKKRGRPKKSEEQ